MTLPLEAELVLIMVLVPELVLECSPLNQGETPAKLSSLSSLG